MAIKPTVIASKNAVNLLQPKVIGFSEVSGHNTAHGDSRKDCCRKAPTVILL
jgi:hypothetical protein